MASATLDIVRVEDEEPSPTCWEAFKQAAPKWKLKLACCLAVAQGWTSILCLRIYGTFASIMTGNVLLLVTACVGGKGSTSDSAYHPGDDGLNCGLHFSVLGSYCFGFILYRCLTTLMGFYISSSALALVVALLLLTVDVIHAATDAHGGFEVCFAAVALGIVNVRRAAPNPRPQTLGLVVAAEPDARGSSPLFLSLQATALIVHGITTQMITISLQKLLTSAMDLVFQVGKRPAKCDAIKETGLLIGSFALGACIGAVLYDRALYRDWVFSPLAAIFFVLLVAHDYVHAAAMQVKKMEADAAQTAVIAAVRSMKPFSSRNKSGLLRQRPSESVGTPSGKASSPTAEDVSNNV